MTQSCLHQLQTRAALARFADCAVSLPATDEFLLLEDAVAAWPEFAARLAGRAGHVLAIDLQLSGLDSGPFTQLRSIPDSDWPALLARHRRLVCWS